MKIVQANTLSVLLLGKQGEHLVRQIVFDLSEWVKEYGEGVAELIYQRPGDEEPYPIAAVRTGQNLIWTLSATDTEKTGNYGKCEVHYYVGDAVIKSEIWRTWVDAAMDTDSGAVPPESENGWVEQVLKASAAAKDAASRAEAAVIRQPYPDAETSTWWVWDSEKGAYTDSEQPTCSIGGVSDHRELAGCDAENQHPIQAITDLNKELNACVKTANAITALDIIKLMEE